MWVCGIAFLAWVTWKRIGSTRLVKFLDFRGLAPAVNTICERSAMAFGQSAGQLDFKYG